MTKYSDLICQYLQKMGYTHCFSVAGGNIMHLVGSAEKFFKIIPVVNEIACGIAVEYFNESQNDKKAFALVTAGPGLTNMVTAIAGAYLESRELLVIGGQVKTEDLMNGKIRQRGIQEIDGVSLVSSITNLSIRLDYPVDFESFKSYNDIGLNHRKGPVFIEIPLDVQAKNIEKESDLNKKIAPNKIIQKTELDKNLPSIIDSIKSAKRPILLIGGEVERGLFDNIKDSFLKKNIPIMLTWNGADRIPDDYELYFGRPNIWGQRYSNILIQQSDLLIAVGTRLGLQQTGFNWQSFVEKGKIIQVYSEESEIFKGHPNIDIGVVGNANEFLIELTKHNFLVASDWVDFCKQVKKLLPINELNNNVCNAGYVSPYSFGEFLSEICNENDLVIPCSSGGAFSVTMQIFKQKKGQIMITNKALASMGYGLSGAIGASIAYPQKRTILIEGDGGFSQNLQEIATAVANNLNLKIFIFENSGYASIRMTQKNYFGGKYVGCDTNTGLGFPNWFKLFDAYGVEAIEINNENFINDKNFLDLFDNDKCVAFIVRIDPEQTYFPKISSRVKKDGGMESNPLHLMTPDLEPELAKKVFKYIDYEKKS